MLCNLEKLSLLFLVFYLCYSAAFGRVLQVSELCKVSVVQVSEGVCQEFRWRCSLCWFILTPILVPHSFPSGLFLTQPRLTLDALNLLLFASPGFVIHAVLRYICSGSKQLKLRCEYKQFSSLSYCVYILNDCTTMVAHCCEIYLIKQPLWLLLFKGPSLWREQVLVRLQTVSSDCLSLHLSLFLFFLCRVSGTSCDWTVGGCQESKPQWRRAGLSQGNSLNLLWQLSGHLCSQLFVDTAFCFIRVLQLCCN